MFVVYKELLSLPYIHLAPDGYQDIPGSGNIELAFGEWADDGIVIYPKPQININAKFSGRNVDRDDLVMWMDVFTTVFIITKTGTADKADPITLLVLEPNVKEAWEKATACILDKKYMPMLP